MACTTCLDSVLRAMLHSSCMLSAWPGFSHGEPATTMLRHHFVAGVWEVGNVLEACYNNTMPDFEPQTLSITVADVPGVLNHVRTCAYPHTGLLP